MSEQFTELQKSEMKALIMEAIEEFFDDKEVNISASASITPIEEKLISLKDVQKVVGCSAPKLFMLRRAKRFPAEIRIGKSVFFDRQKFIEFLNNGGTRLGHFS